MKCVCVVSCGACGYDLKLSSSARDTAGMVVAGGGGGYRRRRGVVRFGAIDDARFGHVDEFRCVDVRARRLFTRRTRLLCRKCGAHVGFAYDDRAARSPPSSSPPPPRYDIKIRALHPIHLSRPISESNEASRLATELLAQGSRCPKCKVAGFDCLHRTKSKCTKLLVDRVPFLPYFLPLFF